MEIKKAVKKAHKILKLRNPDLKLGHVYDLFSQAAGYKNWNIACTEAANLDSRYLFEKVTGASLTGDHDDT